MLDFSGKKVLVTGATGGIGYAIAKAFYQQGATVALSGTRQEKLQQLASELGERSHIFPCNLTNRDEVNALIDSVSDKLGGIDVLIANAGITKDNLALRMKEEDWDAVLEVNLTSTFLLNKNVFKKMMKQRSGRIINISSVVGVSGNPGQANYVASKAGMIGMSKSLAMEFSSRGVTVNCIAPGFIKTEMTDVLTDAQKENILSTIPMRELGKPEDIANAALFLASEEAGYITGHTLHVNGGMLMV